MIRRCLTTLLLTFWCNLAMAGTFADLAPGVSRKADVDRVMGLPIRELAAGTRYDYDPASYEARRISVEFSRESGVIVSIDLYLAQQYSKSDYQSWFELNSPTTLSFDNAGDRVENYAVAGISLHFDGPGANDPVRFFRHYDPLAVATAAPRSDRPGSDNAANQSRNSRTSAEHYVARAEQAESNDDWSSLQSIVEEGLQLYPDQACLWNLRGSFFYNDGGGVSPEIRRDEILRSSLHAYSLVPDYDHTADLAWTYYRVFNDCSSANYYFEEIEAQAASKPPFLLYVMGTCYERNGDIENAISFYRRYLARQPETEQAAKVRDRLYVLDR